MQKLFFKLTFGYKKNYVTKNIFSSFDTSLPYSSVSYSFTGLRHYWEVQSRLSAWSALKHIPKCWAVIQPLLCAVRTQIALAGLIIKHIPKCLAVIQLLGVQKKLNYYHLLDP